ncbi:hypothetical protein BWR22_03295 [Lacinutrix venerupis]|uniref:Lipoprotein n=1 Tax=Lacinutrix venerupis TaxID=1486034 RepID=A0AAC9LJ47_9FLAO|nr:hypothetical protein BWR22_03295 [Lacinutrix venerupis]
MKYDFIFFLFLCVFLFSCSQKGELELEILTEYLTAYCKDGDCSKTFVHSEKAKKIGFNVVKFKMTNYSSNIYVVASVCDDYKDVNCSSGNAFPSKNESLEFKNLIVYDDSNNAVEVTYPLFQPVSNENDIYNFVKDSLNYDFYRKIGEKNKSGRWQTINVALTNKMIVIHPNETLFFTSYIILPKNSNQIGRGEEEVNIEYNKNYSAKLEFYSSIDSVTNYLTDTQKATFESNNYVFYSKPLISINSIPIKFKR